jgi:hypothetical protein
VGCATLAGLGVKAACLRATSWSPWGIDLRDANVVGAVATSPNVHGHLAGKPAERLTCTASIPRPIDIDLAPLGASVE